jgi:hypothetical protein
MYFVSDVSTKHNNNRILDVKFKLNLIWYILGLSIWCFHHMQYACNSSPVSTVLKSVNTCLFIQFFILMDNTLSYCFSERLFHTQSRNNEKSIHCVGCKSTGVPWPNSATWIESMDYSGWMAPARSCCGVSRLQTRCRVTRDVADSPRSGKPRATSRRPIYRVSGKTTSLC